MISDTPMSIDNALIHMWCNLFTIAQVQYLYKETLKGVSNKVSNKTRYKKLKGLKRYIKKNCFNIHKSTRMLMLATLCYLNGEYTDVVAIVEEMLKIYGRHINMIGDPETYMNKICGEGYTLKQKFELGVFSDMFLLSDCGLYPQEIESEIVRWSVTKKTIIPSIVYSNVLIVLSYFHLKLTQGMNLALNELYIAVHDSFILGIFKPVTESVLQKCSQLAESLRNDA